jgi:exportin-2 (importin alpha re-exporter)
VKKQWSHEESNISPQVRAGIRARIIPLLTSVPDRIQKTLSAAVATIADVDFPRSWPTLMQELSTSIRATLAHDGSQLRALLFVADSIFERYQERAASSDLIDEIVIALKDFAEPVLEPVMQYTDTVLVQSGGARGGPEAALMLSIIVSLTWYELPEYFEDRLEILMAFFHRHLTSATTPLEVAGGICRALAQFAERYEADVQRFIGQFLTDVWSVLARVSSSSAAASSENDALVSDALQFFSSVARSGCSDILLASPDTLGQLCEHVVLPHILLHNDDVEQFEDNPYEYIRREMEGTDYGSRRRAAADLLRALVRLSQETVSRAMLLYVDRLASDTSAKGTVAHEGALFLVTAIGSLGYTHAQGCTELNKYVDMSKYFTSLVLPRLQVPSQPLVDAAALRFLYIFRAQLPRDAFAQLMPLLVRCLAVPVVVVHSYAAMCLERLLGLKRDSQRIYSQADIVPFLHPVLSALFGALQFPGSRDNFYLMRCVLRVVATVGDAIVSIADQCIAALTAILTAIAADPSQPLFNHYLFESYATIVKICARASPQLRSQIEQAVFPPFQTILREEKLEDFKPYVFQILAFLASTYRTLGTTATVHVPLPAPYVQLVPPSLHPSMWSRSSALTHAMSQYLADCITADAAGVLSTGATTLQGLLGVVQKLLSSRSTDHLGVALLLAIVSQDASLAQLAQLLPTLFQILFARLQAQKTDKYTALLCVFVSFLAERGVDVRSVIDGIQPNLFRMYIASVHTPAILRVGTSDTASHRKMVATYSASLLLRQSDILLDDGGVLYTQLVGNTAIMLQGHQQPSQGQSLDDSLQILTDMEGEDMSGTSAQLSAVSSSQEPDYLPHIDNVGARFVSAVGQYIAQDPVNRGALLTSKLSASQFAAFYELCQSHNIPPSSVMQVPEEGLRIHYAAVKAQQ